MSAFDCENAMRTVLERHDRGVHGGHGTSEIKSLSTPKESKADVVQTVRKRQSKPV